MRETLLYLPHMNLEEYKLLSKKYEFTILLTQHTNYLKTN